MTHASNITNGASLEDCHTNFFALVDLNSVKWRRLCVDGIFLDPLEDPVLKSYSNCLNATVLSAWRRVSNPRTGLQSSAHESSSLSCLKELWIFWYRDEPNLSGLIERPLIEAEQGTWESGLSYECRTLLFKALHNAFERSLLSRGFTRLGRFFVEPQVLPITRKNEKAIAFAFHFFVHGESTVCGSVDVRLASSVFVLDKCHLTASQTGQNVKVILSPYGIEGKLTGVGYRYNDPHMARFLNNWHMFYPHPHGRTHWKINNDMPSVVEISIGGSRMKYPASYVFVTEEDHSELFPAFEATTSRERVLPAKVPNKTGSFPAPALLTPPLSPETSALGDASRNHNISIGLPHTVSDRAHFNPGEVRDYSNLIVHSVSQECFTPVSADKNDDSSALWDFHDPTLVSTCSCGVCLRKHSKGKSIPRRDSLSSNAYGMSNPVFGSNLRGKKSNRVPFHRQKPSLNTLHDPDLLSKSEPHKSMSTDFRTSSVTTSALPQLQTPFSETKKLTPLPVTDSYTLMSSSDPVMPTLSPQPPVIKEEADFQSGDSQSQLNVSSLCQDSSQGVPLKGKISDELLSPFYTSLLKSFENAKLGNKKSPQCTEIPESEDAPDVVQFGNTTWQVIEKPQLLKRNHEKSEETEMTGRGLLYNYGHLDSPLWQPHSTKLRRVSSQNSNVLPKEEINNYDCDNVVNTYELSDDIVPCVPKDPYEFTEFDETAPSDKGFRQKVDFFTKEGKLVPSSMPPTIPPSIIPLQSQDGSTIHLLEDPEKALSPAASKNFCPKFIREEDLAVSYTDLDNIFDTSSSEEDNSELPVTPSKLLAFDEFSGKIELSRMYPTPPSLEQHAVPSPFGPMTGIDIISSENDAYKDDIEIEHSSIPQFDLEDINVWYPTLIHEFPESSKYSPVTTVPSLFETKSDQELVYKPLWIHSSPKLDFNAATEENELDSHYTYSQQTATYDDVQTPNQLYSQESIIDSSFCEAVSPVSSVPSYLNKNMNSMDGSMHNLEIHALVVNLVLSDSMLNVFKDHNFNSCCLCVCNMNIKGSDAGIILPNSLIPTWNDEPQYKCTCGFSAVVHRHESYNSGLFYEDELEVTGSVCDSSSLVVPKIEPNGFETPQSFILDLLRVQCKTLVSSFSLFHKCRLSARMEEHPALNQIQLSDGNEICFMALEEAKSSMESAMSIKFDENLKSSCLHKWPYVSSPLPNSNKNVRSHLESLQPLLQGAINKYTTQRNWQQTYMVAGPLTWRDFHKLAARGTEDQCDPQPIPSLLMGHDKDSIALSPLALKFWDKLHLEPHSLPRDVAYIAVVPENELILSSVKSFFRDLSSTYETHRFGKHRPITKVLRDGIMRVGKTAASKVAEEPVNEWFNTIGDGPIPNKLKLYARVCKHRLAPHLSTLSLDSSIFKTPSKSAESSSSSHFSDGTEKSSANLKQGDNEHPAENLTGSIQEPSEESLHQPPALVIYIVEPFTYAQSDPNVYRLVSLGLLHSYADMLSSLPEAMKSSIYLQILSLDSIMCYGGDKVKQRKNKGIKQKKDKLKTMALSVFSQCHQSSSFQLHAKSLTGFGPAAAQDKFSSNRNTQIPISLNIFNQPFILASVKDKQTQLGEMFGDGMEKCGVLYCSYCLTKDRKYILACCTNDKGEFTETTAINIGIPNRHRRKQASVRRFGLKKLLDFILDVISSSVHSWRLVIDRFGRLGHGELKAWASLLNRKSLQVHSKHLRELCNQCSISGGGPSILSASLISLGPDSAMSIMPDQFSPSERCNSRSMNCPLTTPDDATCTHILVFPTSATTQPAQTTLHQEQIDPLPGGLGEDFLEALEDDGLAGQDINDIYLWTTESPPSPGNSSRRDDLSQPSSPGAAYRMSSAGQEGSCNKSESLLNETYDEALQLLQQPLALGYYVSTAKTGPLPKWFWSTCPHSENKLPVFLKSALLIHLPFIQQSSDDLLHSNTQQQLCHPLDSNITTDVLRYVLEGYNALSWLQLNSKYCDRRSCLPIHMQILMQMYGIVEAIL